jgi:uncharacterized MAPEG superfamily protein
MTTDLFYLALTAGLAAVLWIPNVVGIVAQHGMISAEDFKSAEEKPLTGWRQRAKRVHLNMTENLAHFAVLVVVAHLAGMANETTAIAAQVFFWARLAHAVVFYAGIPFLRTIAFSAGFIAEIFIFVQIIG